MDAPSLRKHVLMHANPEPSRCVTARLHQLPERSMKGYILLHQLCLYLCIETNKSTMLENSEWQT